ncbi:hypothetical protein ACFC36_16160 [Streptomyces rubiginosohelvolus]|uniref:hypothetical protein n=1 Tax=Streptomyces rubiginosohelvolus TaxID=67362 RepID=UPI0035DA66F1
MTTNAPLNDRIKHLVSELDEAVATMRQEPAEGDSPWSWDDEHAAGLNLADAAEALILALPADLWPPSWFKDEPEQARALTPEDNRLVDELLEQLGS